MKLERSFNIGNISLGLERSFGVGKFLISKTNVLTDCSILSNSNGNLSTSESQVCPTLIFPSFISTTYYYNKGPPNTASLHYENAHQYIIYCI